MLPLLLSKWLESASGGWSCTIYVAGSHIVLVRVFEYSMCIVETSMILYVISAEYAY